MAHENFDIEGTNVLEEEEKNKNFEQKFNKLKIKNEELNLSKSKLEDKIKEQKRAYYISSNFDKIDEQSFNNMEFISRKFDSDGYPKINLNKFRLIKNQNQLDELVNEAKTFKNYYTSGDIVTDNSSFNINKNDICYRTDGKRMKLTKEFTNKYPQCMVCNIIDKNELDDSDSWKSTKTNINEVCLFNPESTKDSGIPNLEGCKKMCGV